MIPQEFGTPLPPYFFLLPSYWTGGWWRASSSNIGVETSGQGLVPELQSGTADESNTRPIERLTPAEEEGVRAFAISLRKQFANGVVAVRNLSFAMVENQITCLLGHNGAGKSTAIALMTGLLSASQGDFSVYGHRLTTDLQTIRRITGICPQHNVLFPTLTVQEHLSFFGELKGFYGKELRREIDLLLGHLLLVDKRHVRASALSGGMQRKLCLGMALIGTRV